MRPKAHSKYGLAFIAVIISSVALIISFSQAIIAWRVMNRSLESTLLQQRISQCSTVIGLIQDFSNRNAEYRVLRALQEGRTARGISGVDFTGSKDETVTSEMVLAKAKESSTEGRKAADYVNTVRHLYDQQMKGLMTSAFYHIFNMLGDDLEKNEAYAIELARTLHQIMGRCDAYGSRYDSFIN